MSLVTRCPDCGTTFRTLPAQLSARGGQVRCGKCNAVFDGVANLLTVEAIAELPAEPSPQMGLFDPRNKDRAPRAPESVPPAIQIPAPPAVSMAEPALEPKSEPLSETATVAIAATAPPPPAPLEDTSVETDEVPTLPVPEFLVTARPRSRYTLVWSLLSLLCLTALAGQAIVYFRSEIAVLLPVTRSYLETACDTLGCEMRLPRRADLMSIESSDLQADSKRKGVIVLNALLRNRAPFSQEYPDLELTLTDQGDRAVIRRVLKPGEYLLQKNAARAQGIVGGGEEAVRIHLDTGDMQATGYQLFLFYPCPAMSPSPFWQLSYPSRCQDSRNK